jgi:hypothetical protein
MSKLPPLIAATLAAVLAGAAQAQPAAAPAAAPKVAVTSLVGDTMSITFRRDTTATNLQKNPTSVLKVPGPAFDHAVLKAAQEALARTLPAATVTPLRVPAAGSSADPAQLVVDGKVAPGNPLVEALRQQGYTHLLAATKLRAANGVRLAEEVKIGTGQLEGIGFYIDPNVPVQRVDRADTAEGIIAPHVYIRLSLLDLGALEVSGVQAITASTLVASSRNKEGTDPWGAMTPEEKVEALQRLIQSSVGRAVPVLFQPK